MDTNRNPCELALYLTKRSTHPIFKMAAVVVDRSGRIFAWGWNHHDWHAEQHAFSRANRRRLIGATLFVAGMKRGRELITSRPCRQICERLCRKMGIARVRYATLAGWQTLDLTNEEGGLPPDKKVLRCNQSVAFA